MKYTVQGRGPFPLDMLRYDGSQPCSMVDQVAITASQGPAETREQLDRVRTINLETDSTIRAHARRWESFGWKVIDPL